MAGRESVPDRVDRLAKRRKQRTPGLRPHDSHPFLLKVPNTPAARAMLKVARARGRKMRELILASGAMLSSQDIAARLGIDVVDLPVRRQSRELLGLPSGNSEFVYPAWQLRDGDHLPGFREALQRLPVADPWMQAAFFLSPNAQLGDRSPLEELTRGNVETVERVASAYGEQGAA